ncbi:secreted RxLR effector protein 161-like [Rutidosis leptorrhynchoides]|uniref:secreted RxLR effector protein 161-like n=1 Tax=Rutidosis leptorrhynchoides TaxID=125765 RepID=UPI003A99CB04
MSLFANEFSMKDLGSLSYFLGIAVQRNEAGLFLSQATYAQEILNRTGALQYLTFTRPDIAYAVQQICLHMQAPKECHMHALRRILRYIKGTVSYGLQLSRSSLSSLISYTDADWGGCPDTRRSTSGYYVYLGGNLVSWSAKRQPTVSRSSAEAEYRGIANVVSESCWLRNILLELRCPITKATIVFCDNVSAMFLSGNPISSRSLARLSFFGLLEVRVVCRLFFV